MSKTFSISKPKTRLSAAYANTTSYNATGSSDNALATLTIPANRLVAGDVFDVAQYYTLTVGANSATINIYIKINGTKFVSNAISSQTNLTKNISTVGAFTVRAIGASGAIEFSTIGNNNGTLGTVMLNTFTTIDTTAAVTVEVGFAFSGSASGLSVTPKQAFVIQK